jgi:hypothetical protein
MWAFLIRFLHVLITLSESLNMDVVPHSGLATIAVAGALDGATLVPSTKVMAGGGAGSGIEELGPPWGAVVGSDIDVRPHSGSATIAVAGALDGAALIPSAKFMAGGGAGSVVTVTWLVNAMVGLHTVVITEVEGSAVLTEVIVGVLVLRGPES